MIDRTILSQIRQAIDFEKAIIIKGARQVGKTTLIQSIAAEEEKILWIDGDDPATRNLWNNISKENLKAFTSAHQFIIFDEAQRIENVGLSVKMLLDLKLKKQVIVSGSSSLDLASSINEPLTGRKWSFDLFPISWQEQVEYFGLMDNIKQLDSRLILGSYPEILTAQHQKVKRLQELSSSYLYRDILEYADIRKPELIIKLLKALAFQLGNEVSYNELAGLLQVDHLTVQKYIGLLEDSFVIFRLPPLSTNPRKEISTSRKIYFYDNGIRNAIINNFEPLSNRNDVGVLWENFIVSEFIKQRSYSGYNSEMYFWRSKSQSEIDLVLKEKGTYKAIEIKYSSKRKAKFAPSFIERYNPVSLDIVHSGNFWQYLGD